MRRFKLLFALAVIVAQPFVVGGLATSVAEAQETKAQEQTAKVSYLPLAGGDYSIDPLHSIIGFSIRHLEINWVEGRFKDFKGTIHLDDKDITKSTVEFTAKVESIDTGVAPRDTHLKSADFFDAAKYPELSFKSTRIERQGQDRYVLHGDLMLKGVTKPVVIPFTITGAIKDPWGNTRFGISGQTKINRRNFGINYGNALPGGGLDVSDEVTINLFLEAVMPGPKPAGQ